ncbi:hypothetical protein YTPLAS21_19540 [Candidatus Nitrosocosmicus sp.]|nr:hypothetical protein YTPLAS21_19540 [Candidatus Nitrosocosmicus sp.]
MQFLRSEKIDINKDNTINELDILSLTKLDAINLYKKYWWNKYRFKEINSFALSGKYLDSSILFGMSQATLLLQKTLNKLIVPHIDEDGILGSETINAINFAIISFGEEKIIKAYNKECNLFIDDLLRKNIHLSVFEHGWQKRINYGWEDT